jgi:hypothetical protein
VAERTSPLLGFDEEKESWDNSTVVARFSKLQLAGQSTVFGPVVVSLDDSVPAFGVVRAGKCAAALPIQVDMPAHNLILKSEEPVQLRSQVQTVPPIGDERTESVRPVKLINAKTNRSMGSMVRAKIAWRELTAQTVALQKDRTVMGLMDTGSRSAKGTEERLSDLTSQVLSLLQELEAVKATLKSV